MKKITTIFITTLLATAVFAHEYVLIAYDFFVQEGEKLELHLFVADGFNIEIERPLEKTITRSFKLISENGTKDLLATSANKSFPVLEMDIDFKGQGLIAMERDYSRITLANEKFKSYLKGDNIEHITIDETKNEQTERYSRYIKTLIQSDPKANDDIYKTVIGHNFEIVLLQNPYELKEGDWIEAKVFFMGKPLMNKVITARNRLGNEPATFQYSRTDENGLCSFKLERAGDWFFHATHMIESLDTNDTDWESFWTSYSFGVKEN